MTVVRRGRWTCHPRYWDDARRQWEPTRWRLDDSGWYLRLDPNYHRERRAFECIYCWIPRQEGRRRWRYARWFLDREQHAPDGSTYSLVPQCTHRDRLPAAMAAVEAAYDERILRALAGELVV